MKKLIFLTLVLSLSGCSHIGKESTTLAPPPEPTPAPAADVAIDVPDTETSKPVVKDTKTAPAKPNTLEIGAIYTNNDNYVISDSRLPERVFLQFPVIPGALYGDVLTNSTFSTTVEIGKTFELQLDDLAKQATPYATPLLATEANKDLAIAPKDTRLMRIETFAYSTLTGEPIGPTGLSVRNNRQIQQLLLVYVDRPATISGSKQRGTTLVEHDIQISKAGFCWLKVEMVKPGLMRIEQYTPTGQEIITIRPGFEKTVII